MKQMVCFSPEDTLFVLNRWDTIPTRQQLNFFNSTRERIKSIWSENIDRHIVRLSGGKVKKVYLLYKGKHILPPVLSYNSLYLYWRGLQDMWYVLYQSAITLCTLLSDSLDTDQIRHYWNRTQSERKTIHRERTQI